MVDIKAINVIEKNSSGELQSPAGNTFLHGDCKICFKKQRTTHSKMRFLLNDSEVEQFYGLKTATLRKARCTGTGAFASLKFIKIGKNIFYNIFDIEEFIEQHTVMLGKI
jgi:hypothetical protein